MDILLLLSMSFRYIDSSERSGERLNLALQTMTLALAKSWNMTAYSEEYRYLLKLMLAAQLTIAYGRPFHALSFLRDVGHSLGSDCSRLSPSTGAFLPMIHFLLER